MKIIMILTLNLLITVTGLSQSNKDSKIIYSEGIVTMFFIDDEFNYMNEVPFGKNVIITKDTFFKNYKIVLDTPDEKKTTFNLRYIQAMPNDKIRVKDIATSKVVYFEVDDLLHLGQLMLVNEKYYEKNGSRFRMMFLFENMKLN